MAAAAGTPAPSGANAPQPAGRSPGSPAGPSDGGRAGRARSGSALRLVVKLLLLVAFNGVAIMALPAMVAEREWAALAATVLATAAIDWIYLSHRSVPAKYLIPGTVFLVVFQVLPVLYTGYVAFTNYGTGNTLTKSQAIQQIESRGLVIPADAERYTAALFAAGGDVALLLTDQQGAQFLGTAEGLQPLETAGEVSTAADGAVTGVGPYERLSLGEAGAFQAAFNDLRVPVDEGEIRLQSLTSAALAEAVLSYDPAADRVTDQRTGTVYEAVSGSFVSPQGERINPGWRVPIGFDNFLRAFTSPAIRGPFIRVFVWTYVFALLSVITTFALGLGLAMTLNHSGVRGRVLYRSLLIIPYALPSFMSALIWAGLFNTEFGAVNRTLGAAIPWLTDPWLAKLAILIVNLWLGFPYMFLICTGALQSIPGELTEAAAVDGASAFQRFRSVTFPLLLIAVAPLLIASFAFNFNNFNVIYLLTRGGPPIIGATTPAGHSDILISYTYRLAFEAGRGSDYGFAAAISVLIFLMVAAISAYSFRFTRTFEEIR